MKNLAKRARRGERNAEFAKQQAIGFAQMAGVSRKQQQHLVRILTVLVAANKGRIEIPVDTIDNLPPTARVAEEYNAERRTIVLTAMVPRPVEEKVEEEQPAERVAVYDANGVLVQPAVT